MKKYLLGIEINDRNIRYIALTPKGKRLNIYTTGVLDRMINTAEPGDLKEAINDIAAKEEIQISRVFVSINRASTVVHQLNLPRMGKGELDEVVPGEIEKIPNFFSNDFDYVYHVIETTRKNTKVVFGAINDNHLQFYLRDLRKGRFAFNDFDLVPLNIACILKQFDKTKEDTGLIIVNDKTTYLLIVNHGDLRYLYSTSQGMRNIHGGLDNKRDDIAFENWVQEIRRAVKSYTVDQKVERINRFWMIHDITQAPALAEEMSTALNATVEPLYLEHMNNGKHDDAQPLTNPIFLLAATPLIYHTRNLKPVIPFNYFFRDRQARRRLQKILFLTLIYLVGVSLFLMERVNTYRGLADTYEEQQQTVAAEIRALNADSKDLFRQRDEYLLARNQLLYQATYVKLLNRMSWSKVLETVARELPDELALTSFEVSGSGSTQFNGQAFQMESIAELMRQIEQSDILRNARFDFLSERVVRDVKIFNFGIMANLKVEDEQSNDQ